MPLFRAEFQKPRTDVIPEEDDTPTDVLFLNREAADEKEVRRWIKKEHGKVDCLRVFPVHRKQMDALEELGRNLNWTIGEPFASWRNGNLVELDLGGCTGLLDDQMTSDMLAPLSRLTRL